MKASEFLGRCDFLNNVNGFRKATIEQTARYLSERPELEDKIRQHFKAYEYIIDLLPYRAINIATNKTFPILVSKIELENSFILCTEGFYYYAFIALRTVLELGLLTLYFGIEKPNADSKNNKTDSFVDEFSYFSKFEDEESKLEEWLSSKRKTPWLEEMFRVIEKSTYFSDFDQAFMIKNRIKTLYDYLSKYVHARGYKYNSWYLNRSNVNRFSSKSFKNFSDKLFEVVSSLIALFLIEFPIGMHGLPLERKFGLNSPIGGFLESYQVDTIKLILPPEWVKYLEDICKKDRKTQELIKSIESLPDITDEAMKEQRKKLFGDLE